MGAKGLWRHVEGSATAPVPYAVSNSIPMLVGIFSLIWLLSHCIAS